MALNKTFTLRIRKAHMAKQKNEEENRYKNIREYVKEYFQELYLERNILGKMSAIIFFLPVTIVLLLLGQLFYHRKA